MKQTASRPYTERVLFVCIAVLVLSVARTEVPRPRGVSLSRAALYDPSRAFTCFDNTLTIPFAQVNDDYCDCPDGSDEPGTAACPQAVFHCANVGHQPLNILSSRVNDGVCDCCDGTDEYRTQRCRNDCKERGQHAREAAQRRATLVAAGKQLRAELSAEGIKMKQAKKEKLGELHKQKAEADLVLREKEQLKKSAEDVENVALAEYRKIETEAKLRQAEEDALKNRQEASDIFEKFDSNADGLLSVEELQTRQPFDTDRNGEVSREEAMSYLNNQEAITLEDFIGTSWPAVKPILMREAGAFGKRPEDGATGYGVGEVEEVPLTSNDRHQDDTREVYEDPEDSETPDVDDDESETQEDDDLEPEEHDTDAEAEIDSEVGSSHLEYDEETQQIVQQATHARSEFTDAEHSVRNIQSEITQIEDYLRKDFGADEAFAALEGHCFEYTDHEYIYRLCPFDKAVQQAKASATDMRLGTWGKWTGPAENIYESMLYDHGQSCWNGPARSTRVLITCSGDNKLVAVSEPNRCEYLFEFTTPAACYEVEPAQDVHEEL